MSYTQVANEISNIINANAPRFDKNVSNLTLRKRLLLAMLQKRSRLSMNTGSPQLTQTRKIREQRATGYTDGQGVDYSRFDRLTNRSFDNRKLIVTDSLTVYETQVNQGPTVIEKRIKSIATDLAKDMANSFSAHVIATDGYATGYESFPVGIESACGVTTPAATDLIATPNDTYGGKATNLGNDGGSFWSALRSSYPNATLATDFPWGNGSPNYDWNSGKFLNYTSPTWNSAGATTWLDNCETVISTGKTWVTRLAGEEGRPQLCLLAGSLWQDFKEQLRARQRIEVPHREAVDLGFPDALLFEGMAIQHDFDVPEPNGYLLNVEQMEIWSTGPELFQSIEPMTYDPHTLSWLWVMAFFGNMAFDPKFLAKFSNYA